MKGVTFHWDAKLGWIAETPFALNRLQLAAAIKYVQRMQSQRVLAMVPGDRREQATRALRSLTPETVKQRIEPNNGEVAIYQA